MTIKETEEAIEYLLLSTNREGIENLVAWLVDEGFFRSPASTKFHGAYRGGLAKHSMQVYETLQHLPFNVLKLDQDTSAGKKPLPIEPATIVIAALLHDICKVGAYLGTEPPYKWNKAQPEGHGSLSVERIKKYINLEPLEAMMIRFHMGFYGLYELYDSGSWEYKTQAEYHIRSLAEKPKKPTPEEKKADQLARYGKTWRNATYHNPIVKFMYFADEMATMEEKLEGE